MSRRPDAETSKARVQVLEISEQIRYWAYGWYFEGQRGDELRALSTAWPKPITPEQKRLKRLTKKVNKK